METFKTKTGSFCILFLILSLSISAQDLSGMKDAFSKSYTYEKTKDYAKAIAAIQDVYDASSYEANLRLGWLCYESKSYVVSAQYYSKAMALMPYSVEAKLGYILPEKALGNSSYVKSIYEAILKIDPQNSYANYNLALTAYNNKDYLTANTYLEKIVNMYPFDYDITVLYAWNCFQLGKLREAKVLFTKVLLISPDDKSALEGLSLIK
jgi:tetratricopeptide (TPR) repeat protein